jgi:hypothetical protein
MYFMTKMAQRPVEITVNWDRLQPRRCGDEFSARLI